MTSISVLVVKIALALLFSGACAFAYLKLAKRRKNVRRESLMVLGALFVFSLLRLLTTN